MRQVDPKLKSFLIESQFKKHKQKQKHKNWKKLKNRNAQGLSKKNIIWLNAIKSSEYFTPPSIFLLRDNAENVLKFINDLKNHRNRNKGVYINLGNVTKISNGSIAILLSVIQDLLNKGIMVRGKKPKEVEAKRIIEKSGFFKYVAGVIDEDNKITPDTIITNGNDVVDQEATADLVLNAMKTVTGIKRRNQPIQGMLIELMANSVNHAFPNSPKNKKWVLSLKHDEISKKALFAFVDNGVGIINTLNRNFKNTIIRFFNGNVDLLNTAFEGGIGSRTNLPYRGKGLPSIYNKYKQNYFTEFVVITNNVLIDFQNEKKITLKNGFGGTFYYWEINKDCEYHGKNT